MRRIKQPAALASTLVLVAVTSAAVVTFSPRDAYAQDDAALQEARTKFQRAIELEAAKNWGGALTLFRDVGQIKMTPQVRYHIATCEENLGKLVAALGGYNLALSSAEGMHPDFISEVQGSIDELNARIPKIVVERGQGAEAAAIELDGVALGESSIGAETPVDPGPHSVVAKAPGFKDYSQTISVAEGSVEVLSVTMEALAAGEVAVNEGDAGQDDAAVEEEKRKSLKTVAYVTGGAGIVLAGVGAAFIGMSQSKAGKVDDLCNGDIDGCVLGGDDLTQAKKWNSQAHTFEAIGWAGVFGGLAAIGTGVVLYVMSNKGSGDETVASGFTFEPSAPATDAGLSLVGRF